MSRSLLAASALLMALLCLASPASAKDVAGVQVPDAVQVEAGPQPMPVILILNGAGVRTKFFMDIYVGALYLPSRAKDAASVLALPGYKQVSMHILYSELSKDKLAKGWREGFEKNTPEAEQAALSARLEAFCQMFPDLKKGDTVQMVMSPGKGVTVSVNGTTRGLVQGDDFTRALLNVWLGAKPADDGLKAAMLGGK